MNNNKSSLIIMKFGGSCLKSPKDFERVLLLLDQYTAFQPIIVVSALNSITDQLIKVTELASQKRVKEVYTILKQIQNHHENFIKKLFSHDLKAMHYAQDQIQQILSKLFSVLEEVEEFGIIPYFIDYVVSFGEKLSCSLLHLYLQTKGYLSHKFYGEDFLITNNEFNNALPDFDHTKQRINQKLVPLLNLNSHNHDTPSIVCVTGFIGRNKIGYTTTLGRGGSDFTATIIARSLDDIDTFVQSKVILWKDVDGILLGDPAHSIDPPLLQKLSYTEAKEIAALGAKILHPKCITILENTHIPIEIRNFHKSLDSPFTLISSESSDIHVKGMGLLNNQTFLSVETPSLINEPRLFTTIYDNLIKNNILCRIFHKSTLQNYFSFVINSEDLDLSLSLIHNDAHLPHDWIEINTQSVGIITILTDAPSRPYVLMKISKILDNMQLSPIFISYGENGISFSLIFPQDLVQDVHSRLSFQISTWNEEVALKFEHSLSTEQLANTTKEGEF